MFAPFSRAPGARIVHRLAAAGGRIAAHARQHWFLDRDAEFWARELGAAWSPTALRARVVEIIDETAHARSFVLAPNRRWPGHRAGQYVPLEVEIDGARARRCYSISSGASRPGAARVTITVQRVPGGHVSSWLHDRVRPGDVVDLGRPAGDFVVAPTHGPLLLVAGGSGITPVIAIVRDLERRDALRDVIVIHSAHDDGSAIFGRELAAVARQHPGFRLIAHRSATAGRLVPAAVLAHVPDLRAREIYACGPPGLVDVIGEAAAHAGAAGVRCERFVAPPPRTAARGQSALVQLGDRTLALDGAGTLLEQLERAGARPAYGCRMGICNTCRCTKQRGTVLDLVTGKRSSEPDQEIRPCISVALSDLALAPPKEHP